MKISRKDSHLQGDKPEAEVDRVLQAGIFKIENKFNILAHNFLILLHTAVAIVCH